MDGNEFNQARKRVSKSMAQKLRVAKEFKDREFDDAMTVVLTEDKALLERLAKV